ncbi:hypothetical protein ES707_04422 [subsurface metagenome]
MDISKARKVVELTKDNRKILLTIYEGGQVSSCIEAEAKKYCETCQCDEGLCQEYIEDMKGRGYQATEVELGELELEESLPKFLQGKEVRVKPPVAVETKPAIVVEPAVSEAPDNPSVSEDTEKND